MTMHPFHGDMPSPPQHSTRLSLPVYLTPRDVAAMLQVVFEEVIVPWRLAQWETSDPEDHESVPAEGAARSTDLAPFNPARLRALDPSLLRSG